MCIRDRDSVISRQKSEILIEYLHKVFCERCGMDLKVSLDYVQTEESRYRKNAAIQIRQEVANVLKHARLSTEEESAAPAPAAEEKTGKEAAAGKTSAARSEKKAEAASEKKPFEKKPLDVYKRQGMLRKESDFPRKSGRFWIREMTFLIKSTAAMMPFQEKRFPEKSPVWS